MWLCVCVSVFENIINNISLQLTSKKEKSQNYPIVQVGEIISLFGQINKQIRNQKSIKHRPKKT